MTVTDKDKKPAAPKATPVEKALDAVVDARQAELDAFNKADPHYADRHVHDNLPANPEAVAGPTLDDLRAEVEKAERERAVAESAARDAADKQ